MKLAPNKYSLAKKESPRSSTQYQSVSKHLLALSSFFIYSVALLTNERLPKGNKTKSNDDFEKSNDKFKSV